MRLTRAVFLRAFQTDAAGAGAARRSVTWQALEDACGMLTLRARFEGEVVDFGIGGTIGWTPIRSPEVDVAGAPNMAAAINAAASSCCWSLVDEEDWAVKKLCKTGENLENHNKNWKIERKIPYKKFSANPINSWKLASTSKHISAPVQAAPGQVHPVDAGIVHATAGEAGAKSTAASRWVQGGCEGARSWSSTTRGSGRRATLGRGWVLLLKGLEKRKNWKKYKGKK